jgi:hypothetical protein
MTKIAPMNVNERQTYIHKSRLDYLQANVQKARSALSTRDVTGYYFLLNDLLPSSNIIS